MEELKLFVGLLDGADCGQALEEISLTGFTPVVFSLSPLMGADVRNVIVGSSAGDIVIDGAADDELKRYIAEIADVIVSEEFNREIDDIRRMRGVPYYTCGVLYHEFMRYDIGKLHEIAADMRSDYRDYDEVRPPFWSGLYRRFIKRYKRMKYSEVREMNDSEISEKYRYYDGKANKYNSIYRSSLYLRALLPLVQTVALAFALNIETVFGAIIPTGFWGFTVIAFFLLQALGNYLIIALSNYVVKHKIIPIFTESRYLAENMRILSVTAPNSLPRIVNNRINFSDTEYRNLVLDREAERIRRDNFELRNRIDSEKIGEIKADINALIDEQIEYHRNNALAMDRCANRLMRLAKAFFVIGLIIIVGRGIYQSVIVLVDFPAAVNEVKLSDFFSKLFNAFALITPAVTVMYMSLRQSLNIDNNCSRSLIMAEKLESMKAAFSEDIGCYELINIVSALNTLTVDEAGDWYIATEQKRVSKM